MVDNSNGTRKTYVWMSDWKKLVKEVIQIVLKAKFEY